MAEEAGRRPSGLASDFGAADGTPITNKSTILYAWAQFMQRKVAVGQIPHVKAIKHQIDEVLGVSKPPDLEYIFVQPFANFNLFGWGVAFNYYGHAAVRYTLPNGTQRVMNITGVPGLEMVHFIKPEDYLFGVTEFHQGSQQGGFYNRSMTGVRIENVDPDQIEDLNHYYERLQRRQKKGLAKFSLFFGYFWNTVSNFVPRQSSERGNCARWTSLGLHFAGLIPSPTMWPKRILVEMLETHGIKNPDNVHVVSYRRVKHARQEYGKAPAVGSAVMPIHPITNLIYWQFERFADVIVEVPEGSMTAEVVKQDNPSKANFWRHNRWIYYCSAAVAMLAFGRQVARRYPTPAMREASEVFQDWRQRTQQRILEREKSQSNKDPK